MRTTVTIDDELRVSLSGGADRRAAVDFPVAGDPDKKPLVDLLDREALAEAMGDNEPARHTR